MSKRSNDEKWAVFMDQLLALFTVIFKAMFHYVHIYKQILIHLVSFD